MAADLAEARPAFGVPFGGPYNTHVVLQTARIPLASFVGATSAAVRSVRFGFPVPQGARNGERLLVRYASNDTRQWDFGALNKSQVSP